MKRNERTAYNQLKRTVDEKTLYVEIPLTWTHEARQAIHEMLTIEKGMYASCIGPEVMSGADCIRYTHISEYTADTRRAQENCDIDRIIQVLRRTEYAWNGCKPVQEARKSTEQPVTTDEAKAEKAKRKAAKMLQNGDCSADEYESIIAWINDGMKEEKKEVNETEEAIANLEIKARMKYREGDTSAAEYYREQAEELKNAPENAEGKKEEKKMFENLKSGINSHFDAEAAKFAESLEGMTNGEALDHWYYRDRMTDAAFAEAKKADAAAPLSDNVKKKMIRRFTNENEKRRAMYLRRIEKAEAASLPENVYITVTWAKNRTWGKNPTAEISIEGRTLARGTASGCGYDKESAAICEAFSAVPAIMRILYDAAEKGINLPGPVVQYTAGLPWWDGGCGVSCFREAFARCGYVFSDVSHGKMFDAYAIRKA